MIAWRVELFEELGSTSDFCIARAKAGEAEGLAVQALRQTAGRGSRGRNWQAPEGNLNLSVLLRPTLPASLAGMFSLLAGVALAEALEQFFAPPTMLKWPNDVLLGGAKLAGILIDAAPMGQNLDWLVIGIGINLRAAPEIAGRATISLAQHNVEISPQEAASALLDKLSAWHTASPAQIREAWLARAHPFGTKIEVRGAQDIQSGNFAGLSPSGELLLQCGDRTVTINTGEILLGQA